MKQSILLAAVAAATCLLACSKPDNPEPTPGPGPETKDEVSVSPGSVAFEADGGTVRVAVTTNVADYSVSGNPDWLTVSKNGKEISLTAAQNLVNEARNCTLTVTAGKATASIAVSQKAGSPYAGFAVCSSATFEYAGTMLYQFLKPTEEDYGGQGYIEMDDEDGNHLAIWVYTELFESEEQVELTPGTYVKGEDNYPSSLAAKKMTYVPGVYFTFADDEEEEEMEVGGSYFSSITSEEEIPLTDGTVEVIAENDGTHTIKVDMTGSDGKAYKYVFQGQLAIDTEGATYPNPGRIDVASTVYGAECYYMGDVYGNGTSNFILQVYSGDEQNPAVTQYEFNVDAVDFSEDIDLSGEYYTPSEEEEGEEPADPFGPGMLVPGSLQELFPGFEMPFGTYIMYSFGDYLLGDAFASLVLQKQEDGKYTMTSAIMSTTGEMVMFMGSDFTGIHDLEIPIIDGRDNGED